MLRLIIRSLVFLFMVATANVYAAEALTYIRAGQVIDVIDGRLLGDQVIVVQGDKIVNVADAADVSISAGATVIDLSGQTVLPRSGVP